MTHAPAPEPRHDSGIQDPDAQEMDDALDELRALVHPVAEAAAKYQCLVEMLKVVRATIMSYSSARALGQREIDALVDPRYAAHVNEIHEAKLRLGCLNGQWNVAERRFDGARSKLSAKSKAARY